MSERHFLGEPHAIKVHATKGTFRPACIQVSLRTENAASKGVIQ